MPTVPRYDNFQVGLQPGGTGRFSPPQGPQADAIGARQLQDLGQAVQGAAHGLARIQLDMQNEANELRVTDGMNQAVQARTEAQLAAMQIKGRDALERADGKSLVDESGAALQQRLDAIRDGLGNDAQKLAFKMQADRLLGQFRGAVAEHTVREYQAHQDEVDRSTVEVAQNQKALLWGDVAMRKQSDAATAAAVGRIAARKGWDDKQRQAALIEAATPGHLGVLKGMLNAGDAKSAAAYLSENSAGMTIQGRAQAQEMTRLGGLRQDEQNALDGMVARGLDTKAMLEEARAKYTGELRDGLERRIEHRAGVESTLRAQATRQVVTTAWSQVMATGRVATDTLAALRSAAPEEERQIRDWLDARMRRAKAEAEGKFTTDMPTYLRLTDMAANERTAFAAIDLERFRPYLSDADLKHFAGIKAGIARGDAKQMESLRVVKSTIDALKFDIQQAGVDLTPKENDKAAIERAQRFTYALTTALSQAQEAKGSPLAPDEAKRIGLSMVREGIEQGSGVLGFLQTRRRGYEIATDPNIKPGSSFVSARFSDIPVDVRRALSTEYRQSNPSIGTRPLGADGEAAVERAYTRGVELGRFRAPGR